MKTAVLGGGNMGGAIAKSFFAGINGTEKIITGKNPEIEVTVTHAREDLRKWNSENGSVIEFAEDNCKAIAGADIVVLAVKPYKAEEVINGIKDAPDFRNKTIISVAAGISCGQLQEMCGNPEQNVFRIIPDTAIMLGQSATFISCSSGCTTEMRKTVREIFSRTGQVYEVEEDLMSALTALSSCGIAYVMRFIADMINAGNAEGIAYELSRKVVFQTVKGALALLDRKDADAETEIKRVCTPGGITEKGLKAMEEHGFGEAVKAGIKASIK
ncbi:MAG: pyrroline-5-carboxylate reductase [Bacteroidales bacterium]|nr:pyrroline-5-carboxylate reductase [Bacteroidales bacterium]